MTTADDASTIAPRLFAQFDRLAEGIDALPRLREFVLDLAVNGRLTAQVPGDEPAQELLDRIRLEKQRLVRQGELKEQRKQLGRRREEGPTATLPSGWAWTTLGELALKITDGAHRTPTYVKEGVPFISVKDFSGGTLDFSNTRFISQEEHKGLYARCDPRRGDILIGRIGTLGKAVLVETDAAFSLFVSVGLIRFDHQFLDPVFFRLLLNSPHTGREFDRIKIGGGTHTNKLNLGDLHGVPLPLPPLAEQRRIVAKVDELMALCDRLEAAKAERERRRDRLVAASTTRLIDSPEVDRESISFYLGTLPRQTTRSEHVRQLRQAILSLAVRGALVQQRADEKPVGGLDTCDLDADDRPFKIPSTWRWVRLASLGKLRGGGTPSKSVEEYWNGDIPWVSPKDMKQDYIEQAQMSITPAAIESSSASLIDKGSILFVVRGMILAHSFPVALARVAVTTNQDMKALVLKIPETGEYLLRALKALKPTVLSKVQRSSHGTCRLEAVDYSNLLIPLPPLAEQRRIVAKVDELMALCDRLEAALERKQAGARRLLESLLHQALHAPA